MKNFIYLGTALHMILLANLSPCHAMEEMQFDAVDAEGKTAKITMRTADGFEISEQKEVIQLTSVFKLTNAKMDEYQTAFDNGLNSANAAIEGILKNDLSSKSQKTTAQGWVDVDLSMGERPIQSRFKALQEENEKLSTAKNNLNDDNCVLKNKLKILEEEKEKLPTQNTTLSKADEKDIAAIDYIVTNLLDNEFEKVITKLYGLEDSDSSFQGKASGWRTKLQAKQEAK